MIVPSIRVARALVKFGAVFVASMFIEYIIFRTSFSIIIPFIIVGISCTIRCRNCKTPIYDHRIAPYVKGFDLKVLEECPVCKEPMLPEE
jgi:hypothetical protein